MNGLLVLQLVVVVLGHELEPMLSRHLMAVLHVLAQQQRQEPVTLMHVQVIKKIEI